MNTGKEVREACRSGRFRSQTSGLAKGFVQANLVILPQSWAWDFLLFAQRNPKPCPVLEVGEVGDPYTRFLAEGADIRTDLPKYRLYKEGKQVQEMDDLRSVWREDWVYFLIGCSFSFEQALLESGLEVRHISEGRNVPMYQTNIPCADAGRFKDCRVVVSMRPFSDSDQQKAIEITRKYPSVHGAPLFAGDPKKIGIENLNQPDWGEAVTIQEGETPLFWGCGVTPQLAAMIAKPPLMITHAPGHMFVGDKLNKDFEI